MGAIVGAKRWRRRRKAEPPLGAVALPNAQSESMVLHLQCAGALDAALSSRIEGRLVAAHRNQRDHWLCMPHPNAQVALHPALIEQIAVRLDSVLAGMG
ncbi:hypothetical protein ABFU04_09550 [Xanthomonas campestris pv. raphani]|uniref:hypothetical protein n=1 Tax=Xanthomonas campestris TaxID=339 RepID=UPI00388E160B